ncbi:hypothetical protein GF323_03550 [Candidatus Woesearchaeota archaeon]|nr:hypothetical protein [Candidatus Woesearchaeota archaeon]
MATSLLLKVLITVTVFIISAVPLHLAVRLLKGKTYLLKTAFITFLAGLIIGAIQYTFETFGGLLAFIVLIWIYHESFRLKWWKAFLAWILQFVFVAVFYFIAALLLAALAGISIAALI